MSDRRRGGSGRGTPLRRAVGTCGAVTTLLALGLCSPTAHADFDDLLDPILNAAVAGIDQADAAFAAFSPDDLAVGVADFGSFADPFGQIDQMVSDLSTQLDDQLRGLGADWSDNLVTAPFGDTETPSPAELPGPDAAAAETPDASGYLFGDDDGAGAAGDPAGSAAATDSGVATGTTPGTADDGSTGGGQGDSSNSAQDNGQSNEHNSNSMPSVPKMSSPGGGSGGGGNGGNKPRSNSSTGQPVPGR